MTDIYPIGIDDFRFLRERRLEYVDKSELIQGILDQKGVQVILLPRPRRFGKTLNLSMLRYFFERRAEDLSHLFQDLSIWRAGAPYREHFQRYPVIHLTFKGVKAERFDACYDKLRDRIQILFNEHNYLLEDGLMTEWEDRRFRDVLTGTADRAVLEAALLDLSGYLRRHHRERVIILIDEYDEPIHAGYVHGYGTEIISFFRGFLTDGLKGNPHLERAVLTGILRVARESIFSGLNNLAVYSLLAPEFNTCFGFTEQEVEALLAKAGCGELLEPVRRWYNGYVFGGQVMYNPWSVLNFLQRDDRLLRNYWVSTSSNDLIKELLQHYALKLETDMETLLEGGWIERRLDENVVLWQLREDEGALWSLLVFSGYLTAEAGIPPGPHEVPPYRLSIPNQEVRDVYTSTFRQWMEARLAGHGGSLRRLTTALLRGDAEQLERQLQAFVTNLLSYHDPGMLDPEQVYHGFVLGLLAVLEPSYQIRSRPRGDPYRESGAGRPDIQIRPVVAGQPGVVLELKVARPPRRTLEQALAEGLEQLRTRDYAAELRAAGAAPIHTFAVAFDGKQVRVEGVTASQDPAH